jgi:hypothetical protein
VQQQPVHLQYHSTTDIILSTEETASMYDWPTVGDVRVGIFKLLESLNLRLSVFESLNL